MERNLDTFFTKISRKSPKTQSRAKSGLKHFAKFCQTVHKKDLEVTVQELKNGTKNDIYDFLQDWINHSEQSPRGVRAYFHDIKKYLRYRDIEITIDDVKDKLDFPKIVREELHPLSDNELLEILKVCDYGFKVGTLAQCSSGVRRGELLQLRKKHFVLDGKRLLAKIPPSIAKFGKARTVIFSTESSILITPKLKKAADDDLIFTKNPIPGNALLGDEGKLRGYLRKLGMDQRYETTGNYKINTHSFRSWFITKMSRHDRDLAYLLSGQEGYLLGYDRLSDEQKLELYVKFEGDLLIYNDSKKDQKISALEKVIQEKDMMMEKFEALQDEVKIMQKAYELGFRPIIKSDLTSS